jgi:hypothetical protein
MSRLFYASGDPSLAKRTLHLYVQVVSKAFEAGSLCIDTTDTRNDDVKWVETLIEGARMLCRISSTKTGLDGREEARDAGVLIRKAKERIRGLEEGESLKEELAGNTDDETRAKVLLAEGIWSATMAIKGNSAHALPFIILIYSRITRARSPHSADLLHTISPSSQPLHFHTSNSFRVLPPSVRSSEAGL